MARDNNRAPRKAEENDGLIKKLICVKTIGERKKPHKEERQMIMDRIALILTIIGALNWGLVGLFSFDLVAWAFGGSTAIISRIVYTVIALAGVWCISLLFRRNACCSDEA